MPDRTLPVLTTPRTRLRSLAAGDLAFLMSLDTDPEVMRHIHAGAMDPASARDFAESQIELARHRGIFGRWVVERATDHERLGWIELFKLTGPRRDDLQVGYQFAPAAQGLGYAGEALRAVLDYAFGRGIDRVAAIVRPENERSRLLLGRSGFTFSKKYHPDGAGRSCELWIAPGPLKNAPQAHSKIVL